MASILVVDDEPGIREFLADALAADGHETVQAGDGLSAMAVLRERSFDLMLTDLRMPGTIDGMALVRRARVERPGMEVIILTAYGTVESAVEAMKLGAFDYLEKPIAGPEALRILVSRALGRAATPNGLDEGGDSIDHLARGVARALGPAYQVEDVIGRGGYAVVFSVHDRQLERSLAVKALIPEFAAVRSLAAQFRREARTAARLVHPNIVPIYFVGRDADIPCFVMPLVEGEPLSQRIRRGPLSVPDALGIARDVASALDFAHRSGVVHRDVKPENILLERTTGRSLLTDFGIARAMTGESGGTAPGVVVGTPQYASPEQAAGERNLDPRSDVYSFAVVIYEMLTGAPPFDGPDARAILAQHVVRSVPSVRDRRPEVGASVEAVLLEALAKDPAARFATAGDLVRALERAGHVRDDSVRAAAPVG